MKLSVIIPNYNHSFFIAEQIESIINQNYKFFELIIIDDKSTDDSVNIIKEIIKNYPKENISLIENIKNIGTLETLNYGLKLSKGDYIYFPSADDRICQNLFEEASIMFKKYPDSGIFSALAYQMNKQGTFQNLISSPLISNTSIYLDPIKTKKYFSKFGFWIVGQTMIFKKICFTELDINFNSYLKHYSDIFLPLIIASKYGACFTPKTLASWRYYSGFAEQNFSDRENELKLFNKFKKLCLSNKYKKLVPLSLVLIIFDLKKAFYINRKFFKSGNNSIVNIFVFKLIFKFFIFFYAFRFNLVKTLSILWSKRRFKRHYVIKDPKLIAYK